MLEILLDDNANETSYFSGLEIDLTISFQVMAIELDIL